MAQVASRVGPSQYRMLLKSAQASPQFDTLTTSHQGFDKVTWNAEDYFSFAMT